ncbi:MAG: hypothetical protein LBF82_00065 [Lactobacillales bacterium]|jgi:hypothetical protein|nr:hypothetical protein [Lactobacillales bacterium]
MKKVEESLSRTIIGGDFHWHCSLHNVGNNSKADCLRHIQLYQVRISHADHIKHMTMHG